MASGEPSFIDSLYPIAVLIDELKNEDVQVRHYFFRNYITFHALHFCTYPDFLD